MGADKPVICCLCREEVNVPSGWCPNCTTYPINITPIRYCASGHRVSVTGWCTQCASYVLTELDPQPGEWIDTGRTSRKLGKEEIRRLSSVVVARLRSAGWPDKAVPLREDMIPRTWKRGRLENIGLTPLGYSIVLPATASQEQHEIEVPF